jgi:hypothetical protein
LPGRNEENGSIQFIRNIITPNFRISGVENEDRYGMAKSGEETVEAKPVQ